MWKATAFAFILWVGVVTAAVETQHHITTVRIRLRLIGSSLWHTLDKHFKRYCEIGVCVCVYVLYICTRIYVWNSSIPSNAGIAECSLLLFRLFFGYDIGNKMWNNGAHSRLSVQPRERWRPPAISTQELALLKARKKLRIGRMLHKAFTPPRKHTVAVYSKYYTSNFGHFWLD